MCALLTPKFKYNVKEKSRVIDDDVVNDIYGGGPREAYQCF